MVAKTDFKQALRALREEIEKSQDIIDANTIDWTSTEIDPNDPGSFSEVELTDARNATRNLESPFDKKDDDACNCDDPNCPCHQEEEPTDDETEEDEEDSRVFGESVVKEATMADIPHEIDDPIHCLRDIIFRLEETKKNWELSGIDVQPLEDIIANTNDLIECMYENGAKLGDEKLAAKTSEEASEASEEKEDDSEEESEEKKESVEMKEGTGNFWMFDGRNLAFDNDDAEMTLEMLKDDSKPYDWMYSELNDRSFPGGLIKSDVDHNYAAVAWRSGYYEGINLGVIAKDREEVEDEEGEEGLQELDNAIKLANDTLDSIHKNFGGDFIERAATFSNGETIYRKVGESAFDTMMRNVLTERGVTNQYNGIMKNVNWVDVMNAIKEQLNEKYGRSLIVNQIDTGDDHRKAFEVSTNGQDLDLPKTLTVNDIKLKLNDNVYEIVED